MSKFKVGDRVRVIHLSGEHDSHWAGREGTLAPNTVNYYPWLVTGEAFNDEQGEGLAVLEDEIEHVEPE